MIAKDYIKKYMRLTDTHAFFYHGPLSQWWYSPFTYGTWKFNCSEQFMMAMKAKMFHDNDIFTRIMSCDSSYDDPQLWYENPREQKRLGRLVKNFDPLTWDASCKTIVYTANMLKFSQNIDLHEILMATGNRTIVEASPVDQIWGVGLDQHDPLIVDPINWRGSNYLGDVLTKTRESLKDML